LAGGKGLGEKPKNYLASFTSFYYFGGAIIGALVGTRLKFPLFFLVFPVVLALFKRPKSWFICPCFDVIKYHVC